MTGYNTHHVRVVSFQGRTYRVIRHGAIRVVVAETNRHFHGERGHA